MKFLTFIGTGKYEPVVYEWKGCKSQKVHLFPLAVCKIFKPQEVVVFVTNKSKIARHPEHKKTYLEELKEAVTGICKIEQKEIPEGKNLEELWKLFEIISETVNEGETIILDVTHAFRSLPLLAFVVAAYLRKTKKVQLAHILYGAYEAREKVGHEEIAPIFDLSLLLELLDWLSGAEQFLKWANARELSCILRKTHASLWQTRKTSPRELPRKLRDVGGILESLSRALFLAQPCEVMKTAYALSQKLEETSAEFERWAKPFVVILKDVAQRIQGLACENPDCLNTQNLQTQQRIIEHLLKSGLYFQAITLAREWIVTYAIYLEGHDLCAWKDYDGIRKTIETKLNDLSRAQREKRMPAEISPEIQQIISLWQEITQLRNTVAHCGMRKDYVSSKTLEENIRSILDKVINIKIKN